MKILLDITHLPHINFFLNAAKILKERNYEVIIICLKRGKNYSIVKKEFKDFQIIPIGSHRGNKFSIIFEANLFRFFKILLFCIKNKFDLGLSVGFLLGSVCAILGKPSLQFNDDPERKVRYLQFITATELYFPSFFKNSKVKNFNCLKEWAYLSPKYFSPIKSILKTYSLNVKEYIFIREVNNKTINYMGQDQDIILSISDKIDNKYQIVLSLENKFNAKLYPASWIVLKEPVESIHSLMYYSKIVISSGDSMAREGALLGVPSIYCGIRNMKANKTMIDKGILFHVSPENIQEQIVKISNNSNEHFQEKFRKRLQYQWDDVTEIIVEKITKYNKS